MLLPQPHSLPSACATTAAPRARRWGLTNGKSVEQTEADLKALFPQAEWRDLHLQIIYFGRAHCPAQRHDPSECPICGWAAVHPYDKPGWSPPRPGERDVKFKRPTPRKAKSPAGAVATTAAASDDEEEEVEEAPPRDGGAANPPAQLAADADGQQQHQGRLEDGDARRVVRRLTAQLNEAANAAGAFPSPAQEGTASSSKPAGSSVRAARKTAIQSALGVSSTTRSAGGRRPATRSTAKSQ